MGSSTGSNSYRVRERKRKYSQRKFARAAAVAGMSMSSAASAVYYLVENDEYPDLAKLREWHRNATRMVRDLETLIGRAETKGATDQAGG